MQKLDNHKHEKYLNLLFKLASTVEPVARMRLAACLVYKNDVIAFGVNKKKTHPFQRRFSKNNDCIYLHAEIDCIVNALKNNTTADLSKFQMYVLRVKRPDTKSTKFVTGIAKPCIGCQRALTQFGIEKVVYSIDNSGFHPL